MPLLFLFFGAALLFALLFAAGQLSRADARILAQRIRKYSGVAVLAGAGLLLLTGRIGPAIFLASFALPLLGRSIPYPFGWPSGAQTKTKGQISTVRTASLELILDHDSGRIAGRVLKGRFAGKLLSELELPALRVLLDDFRRSDGESAQLLEAYLDRSWPGWSGADGTARSGGNAGARSETRRGGNAGMTLGEAYSVLNLSPGASREDVQTAHRDLMKRFHPDQGGSTYLAAKINEAKDVLLKHVGAA
jgi:hypothetical protein